MRQVAAEAPLPKVHCGKVNRPVAGDSAAVANGLLLLLLEQQQQQWHLQDRRQSVYNPRPACSQLPELRLPGRKATLVRVWLGGGAAGE